MILINNVFLPIDTNFGDLRKVLCPILKVTSKEILEVTLHKKSVDARKKEEVCFCCSFVVKLNDKTEKQNVLLAFFQP